VARIVIGSGEREYQPGRRLKSTTTSFPTMSASKVSSAHCGQVPRRAGSEAPPLAVAGFDLELPAEEGSWISVCSHAWIISRSEVQEFMAQPRRCAAH